MHPMGQLTECTESESTHCKYMILLTVHRTFLHVIVAISLVVYIYDRLKFPIPFRPRRSTIIRGDSAESDYVDVLRFLIQ